MSERRLIREIDPDRLDELRDRVRDLVVVAYGSDSWALRDVALPLALDLLAELDGRRLDGPEPRAA